MFNRRRIENELIRREINPIIEKWKLEIVEEYETPEVYNRVNARMVRRLKRILFISKFV